MTVLLFIIKISFSSKVCLFCSSDVFRWLVYTVLHDFLIKTNIREISHLEMAFFYFSFCTYIKEHSAWSIFFITSNS